MKKFKFSIHPLFLVFAVALIYLGYFYILLAYVLTIILHEFAHAFVGITNTAAFIFSSMYRACSFIRSAYMRAILPVCVHKPMFLSMAVIDIFDLLDKETFPDQPNVAS